MRILVGGCKGGHNPPCFFVFSALRNAEVSSGILSERPDCFVFFVVGLFVYFVLDGNSSDYKRDSFEHFEEDGRAVWFERIKRKFGSERVRAKLFV